ncbi:apolipoprotein N-acyltransferase [Arenicella chitinivorans]|uniref:Apolipoprotein N-acyltransferase n=1 Tax=Arenicella chitinivorans TaxID=1329800 RepID=A0A918REN8_9GAMM|nr:apolipoprotein N-acyltransferase [Arenicella chitinivorans]GGZ96132.1 apolipoprotein N-acyltransferase [Arenicella chitinivorans]
MTTERMFRVDPLIQIRIKPWGWWRLLVGLMAYGVLVLSLVSGVDVAVYFFLVPILTISGACRQHWQRLTLVVGVSIISSLIVFPWVWAYDSAYMWLVGAALLVLFSVVIVVPEILQHRIGWIMPELSTPVLWLSMMALFSRLPAGDFWLDIALFQPLCVPLITYIGSVGITFLMVLNNAAWAQLLLMPCVGRALVAISVSLLLLGCWAYSSSLPTVATTHRIALVQGNFSLDWTWRQLSANGLIANTYEQLSRRTIGQSVDLVVWPEYALPVDVIQHNPSLLQRLKKLSTELQMPVMLGAIVLDGKSDHHFDSALLFDGGELTGRYDSKYPAFFNQFTNPGQATLSLLHTTEPPLKIGTIICFEETHTGLFREYTSLGASLFVSLANNQDLGLGRQLAARYGQLRAAEMGRFLVRASNDGVTQVVDPWGRVTQSLPVDESGVLLADIALLEYRTWYSRFQYVGVSLMVLAMVLVSFGWQQWHQRKHCNKPN